VPDAGTRTLVRVSGSQEPWGIEPVPDRLRVLGLVDNGLLWGNLGVSLLVIVAGAILVPALSLPAALVAIVVGCLIGNAMLAVAGMIGADARVPGMALMRAPLGQRGSLIPTGINVLQGIGWTTFELLVIATAAGALSDELFGFEAKWLWTLLFGAATLALALLGPIGFVRRFIRRFAVWAVPLALLYLTWWALDGADLSASRLDSWSLLDVRVTGGSLANVQARGAHLRRVEVSGSRLTGLALQEAELRDVVFRGCRVDLASFSRSRLERVRFEDCVLAEADFMEAELRAVRFEGCDLAGCDLRGARLSQCELRDVRLAGMQGAEALRGAAIPWVDVVENTGVWAAALGLRVEEA